MSAADLGEDPADVLGAPVRVKDDSVDLAAAGGDRHLDRVGDEPELAVRTGAPEPGVRTGTVKAPPSEAKHRTYGNGS